MIERLERAAAANLADYVRAYQETAPTLQPADVSCAGGVAAFVGAGAPLTTIKGAGPETREDDLAAVEEFFRARGVAMVIFEAAP
jgi:hypothetical protein